MSVEEGSSCNTIPIGKVVFEKAGTVDEDIMYMGVLRLLNAINDLYSYLVGEEEEWREER